MALRATLLLHLAALAAAAWSNLTLYHINPLSRNPAELASMDLGDLAGDLFFDISTITQVFACSTGKPTHGVICDNKETHGDIGVTAVIVEADTSWGPYGTCNICINGTSPLNHSHTCTGSEYVCDCSDSSTFPPKSLPCTAHMGWENTSAFLGASGIGKFCGFGHGVAATAACAGGAAADKLQGIWYSAPAKGECKGGSSSDCHWRFRKVIKRIRRTCHAENFLSAVEKKDPKCFEACGTPRNTSSVCYAYCFVDAALGKAARTSTDPTGGMSAKELETAWQAPFDLCPDA